MRAHKTSSRFTKCKRDHSTLKRQWCALEIPNWVGRTTLLVEGSLHLHIGLKLADANWNGKKSTKSICSTMWWGILDSLHGHILLSCSFGMIFLQKESETWKLLIRQSIGGTTRMPYLSTTFKESRQGHCGQNYTICFRWNCMLDMTKWIWSKGRLSLVIMLVHLSPYVLD
jgi:hypothetical protein